jgi:hypothetical protein
MWRRTAVRQATCLTLIQDSQVYCPKCKTGHARLWNRIGGLFSFCYLNGPVLSFGKRGLMGWTRPETVLRDGGRR